MKRVGLISGLIALALAMLAAPAFAQVDTAKAVSVCGTPGNTPVTGNVYPMTADLTGALCVRSAGATAVGGADPVSKQVANNTTSVAICSAACTLYGVYVQNNSATIAYLKLYNAAQGSTTCGAGTPVDRIEIPANASGAGAVVPMASGIGVAYGTALTSCVTTGIADNDTGAPAASTYQISFYKK